MTTGRGSKVRILGADDAAAYRRIRLDALASDPSAFGSSHERESQMTDDEWKVRVQPVGGAVFAVDGPGGPVAIGAVIVDLQDARDCVMVSMWTDPAHRGNGHGRAIVNEIVAFARTKGARRVHCGVTDGNDRAAALYASCGFAFTGEETVNESDGLVHRGMSLQF